MDAGRFRYDYFVIWAHGLRCAEEILAILRGEAKLEIVHVEPWPVPDMRRFVFELYALDSVPLEHLEAKVEHLYRAPSEVLVVFAKHFDPDEYWFDNPWGRFRRSKYIHLLKERIRDAYNPRVDGERTMENVIHASDHEEQVDHFLRMIGRDEGIEFLRAAYGRPEETPIA